MSWRLTCALLAALIAAGGCARDGGAEDQDRVVTTPAAEPALEVADEPQDSVIFEEKMAWARAQRLDTLTIGAAMAAIGRTFVGAPYMPGTLELPGDERLVINLRELDCVTFVENVLVLARLVRAGTYDYDSYRRELLRVRYREGRLNGYPSRLHYFSEWIANNEAKDVVDDITRDLGGVRDTGAIHFMTRHREAYRQLQDETFVQAIRELEERLSDVPRYYIPEHRIADVASRIQDGDIIAATSTLPGLDIAHTGLALRVDGALHLMHAPLVGSVVEISERPLAERIQRIQTQDGIMVARPR